MPSASPSAATCRPAPSPLQRRSSSLHAQSRMAQRVSYILRLHPVSKSGSYILRVQRVYPQSTSSRRKLFQRNFEYNEPRISIHVNQPRAIAQCHRASKINCRRARHLQQRGGERLRARASDPVACTSDRAEQAVPSGKTTPTPDARNPANRIFQPRRGGSSRASKIQCCEPRHLR